MNTNKSMPWCWRCNCYHHTSADHLPIAIQKRASPELLKSVADERVQRSLDRIQRAQDELDRACNELAALCHGAAIYKAAQSVRERVHQLWYKVQTFQQKRKYYLDETNATYIEQRLAAKENSDAQNVHD